MTTAHLNKQTSQERFIETATANGWQVVVSDSTTQVPDEENAQYLYSGSHRYVRRYVPRKTVPAVCVTVDNGVERPRSTGLGLNDNCQGRLYFVEGRYIAKSTTGDYPFVENVSLTKVLDILVERSAARIKDRLVANAQHALEREQEAKEQALGKYRAAQAEIADARRAAAYEIKAALDADSGQPTEVFDVTPRQIEAVLAYLNERHVHPDEAVKSATYRYSVTAQNKAWGYAALQRAERDYAEAVARLREVRG